MPCRKDGMPSEFFYMADRFPGLAAGWGSALPGSSGRCGGGGGRMLECIGKFHTFPLARLFVVRIKVRTFAARKVRYALTSRHSDKKYNNI